MEAVKDGKLDPAWVNQRDEQDALLTKIKAYFIPGTKVRPDVKCSAQKCLLPVRSAEYMNPQTTTYEYNPMIFCFTCNSISHVRCVNLDGESLLSEARPWMCVMCRKSLKNQNAVSFYNQTKYVTPLETRRKQFLRDSTIAGDDKEFESDAEFDSSDLESFKRYSKEESLAAANKRLQQDVINAKAETKRATNLVESVQKDNKIKMDTMAAQIKKLQETIANLTRSMQQGGNQTQQLTTQNDTLSMSTFYAANAGIPDSESTRATHDETVTNPVSLTVPNATQQDTSVIDVLSRFTQCQERMEVEKQLANIRKAMPRIVDFNGDSMKWLEFQQDVQRYRTACKYDDDTIKFHVRGALKGEAFEAVKDVFDMYKLDEIMNILREAFGDPMTMVKKKSKDIKAIKVPETLYREDAVKIRVALQGYFAACTYAKTGYINSNELAEVIYNQLNNEDKARCKEMFIRKNPGKQIVVCLTTIYDYLAERLPILDEKPEHKKDKSNLKKDDKKPKVHQVMAVGATSESNDKADKNSFKFVIRDKSTAPFMGYDLTKVQQLPKKCDFCSKGHYSLECSQYREMSENDRLKAINEKKMCKNCVISSTHQASDCSLKISCGMKLGKNGRCAQKHHATIHFACTKSTNGHQRQRQRNGTHANTNNARRALENAMANESTQGQAVNNQRQQVQSVIQQAAGQVQNVNANSSADSSAFHTRSPRNYAVNAYNNFTGIVQINHVISNEVPKTVKMFKNEFHGPAGYVVAYAIGDSAAEITLVRDDLRRALKIEGVSELLNLQWTDNSVKQCTAIKFDMVVKGTLPHSKKLVLKDCYAIEDLELPARSLDMQRMRERFPYLQNVQFDSYFEEQPVMLIGSPHAFAIESIKGLIEGGEGCPVALEAKLGVTVYGGSNYERESDHVSANLATVSQSEPSEASQIDEMCAVSNEELSEMLNYFNSVESLGIRARENQTTQDEEKAVAILREEMKILVNGAVEVPLIWNRRDKIIPELPNNYALAYKRQIAQEAKLRKNPVHLEAYNKNIKELLDLGYMRYADESDLNGNWKNVWYLPMSLVINANKDPPKFRIVYDASAVYQGVSLNDCLLKGPDLLIDIVKALLRLRMNRIGFTADVQHMFHRLKISLRDQQCQRVLWRETHNEPMKTLILSSMAFGPSSSPFVSQYIKNWNADNWSNKYPEAAKAIKEAMYMDDLIVSESTVAQAVKTAKDCITMCKHINWNLVSFQSNSIEFLKQLPGENVKKDLIPLINNETESYTTKVLGCSWDTVNDCFVFNLDRNIFIKLVNEFNHRPTKRDQASTTARIFDVLGLIAHYTIRGKILLQRSWKLKLGWDDVIPDELQNEWREWLKDIENIARLKIPRMFCSLNSIRDADKIQLHVFCDAGAEAYGTVAYFVVYSGDKVETQIVMAKAKVTPIRFQTQTEIKAIPHLELFAALLASRLGNTVTQVFNDIVSERYFWSDSEVVLRWILNPNQRLIKYAIGPVEEILEHTKRNEWRYVPTNVNPADICTKFKRFDFADSNSMWFKGPDFIKNSSESWPELPQKLCVDDSVQIQNVYASTFTYSTHPLPIIDNPIINDDLVDKYSISVRSSWCQLVRAVARGIKLFMDVFIPLVRHKQLNNLDLKLKIKKIFKGFRSLSPTDLERAEHFIFRKMQRESYPEEYQQLLNNRQIKNKEFLELNAFMDPQGLIRINSRVNLNQLSFPQQFSPLLPRKNPLIPVLLMNFHEKHNHIAAESQIAEIRTMCWIPRLRQALRSIKAHCNHCKLKNAQPYDPMMSSLPEYRVNPKLEPFEVTGVDVLGPLSIKCTGRPKKIYILIFACTLTRFIHLHVLDSLESLRVLEAIVMFWSAHGPVRKFISDNGTNFRGASNILQEDYEDTKLFIQKQPEILQQKLSEMYRVEWEFIPPSSPWFGGFYERLIKEVKRALADTLTLRKISRVELNIAVSEACHRLNLRPLTNCPIESAEEEILTPHHLAKKRAGWPLLPGMHKGKYVQGIDDRLIYRKGRLVADEIMRKFTAYYLPILTKRSKWIKDGEPIKIDDLVLMIEPNKTRKHWPRGRVVKLFYGKLGSWGS